MAMDLFDIGDGDLVPLSKIEVDESLTHRIETGIPEIDKALGGGFAPTSATLLGGEPGVGKSTLLLQLLDKMAENGLRCVYDSAEESQQQLKMASDRAQVSNEFVIGNIPEVMTLGEKVQEYGGNILVVDSIQGLHIRTCDKRPGSPTQMKEACNGCIRIAKGLKIPLIIICQLTADGGFKGPRDLEHNVDVLGMLYHTDTPERKKLLFTKNRFGPSNMENFLHWRPDVGRYDFGTEIVSQVSPTPEPEKPKKGNKPKRRKKSEPTDTEKLEEVAKAFKEYPEKSHRMLAQYLIRVASQHGSFTISETDHRLFGYKSQEKFQTLLQRTAALPNFTTISRDPITLLV